MKQTKPKALKETFAQFFEQPTREALRELLKNHLGEQTDCDFKGNWPELVSVVKHILGIANSGGGCIILGVEERDDKTFEPAGLQSLLDKADFNNGVQGFLPARLFSNVSVQDFSFEASEYEKIIGKKFQVIFVTSDPTHLPYLCLREGKGVRRSAIYIRRQGQTEEANDDEVQQIINARLATGYSSKPELKLRNHLEQLQLLHLELAKFQSMPVNHQVAFRTNWTCESYDHFLQNMIKLKTRTIQDLLIYGR